MLRSEPAHSHAHGHRATFVSVSMAPSRCAFHAASLTSEGAAASSPWGGDTSLPGGGVEAKHISRGPPRDVKSVLGGSDPLPRDVKSALGGSEPLPRDGKSVLGGSDPPPSCSALQLGGSDPPPSSSALQLGTETLCRGMGHSDLVHTCWPTCLYIYHVLV